MTWDILNQTLDGRIMDDPLFDMVKALMECDIEDSPVGWTQWQADFVGVVGLHVMAGFGLQEAQALKMIDLFNLHGLFAGE